MGSPSGHAYNTIAKSGHPLGKDRFQSQMPTTTSVHQYAHSVMYKKDDGVDVDIDMDVDQGSCILYTLLTSSPVLGDTNNNLLHKQRNNGVSWKAKPSWGIYVADQGDNLPKFNLPRNLFYVDGALNNLVSLSLADTCISKFAVDAIVNCTTGNFSEVAGVSQSIHEEAGPCLRVTCASLATLGVGQVAITEGFNLPAKHIIHTNGPHGMEPGWEQSLQSCYQGSLQLLIDRGLRTIVFPCISTGKKGVDPSIAARIALNTVRHFLEVHRDRVDRVIFSLHSSHAIVIYRRYMQWFFPVDTG